MGVDSSVKYVFMISLTGCQEEDESMRFFSLVNYWQSITALVLIYLFSSKYDIFSVISDKLVHK